MTRLGRLLERLYQADPADLPVASTRGGATARLTDVVGVVTDCCHLTFTVRRPGELCTALDRYPAELRGFAYEGAGIGLAALDTLVPIRSRTKEFVRDWADPYRYAIYLGAGMGLARIHRDPRRLIRQLDDDLFGWVVWDGYGFHEGLFRFRRHVRERYVAPRINGFALTIFDQGLGRSIWFGTGADVDHVAATVQAFPEQRRGDLWAGVGLACGYTGGVEAEAISKLRELAGPHRNRLAEGAAIAAKNRHDPGNTADHNELAAEVLCRLPSRDAAERAGQALQDIPVDGPQPAYGLWRERLRAALDEPAPAVGSLP